MVRIHLPVPGTWVRSLGQEDPTWHRASGPMHPNYWICALKPILGNKRSHCNEKPSHCNEEQTSLATTKKSLQQQRPSAAKNKYIKFILSPSTRT